MGPLELLGLAWMFAGSGRSKTTTEKIRDLESSFPVAPAATKAGVRSVASLPVAVDDALVRRANQPRAKAWANDFQNLGVPPSMAQAYARWAGIESSGNPLAVSPIGERGLFQVTKTTAKNTVTPAEWEAMTRPTTARAEHARMALAQAAKYWARAKTKIKNAPNDPASIVWYSKAWHARPADFKGGVMHGSASDMSRQLERQWANDPRAMRRLHASNVIAFGVTRLGPNNAK